MRSNDTPVGRCWLPLFYPTPQGYIGTLALGGTLSEEMGGIWVSGLRARGGSPAG